MAKQLYPPWPEGVVQGIADVLGNTTTGLTGSEIGKLLALIHIDDLSPMASKRDRLGSALISGQRHDGASNCVIRFITEAMQPVRYREEPALFTQRQDALNEVLVFAEAKLDDDGKLSRGARAHTLSEAASHANSIRAELRRRRVHDTVLRYCSQEILERNPFHAVLEAAKSIPDRLRQMTGLSADGTAIVDATLSPGQASAPRIAINALSSQSERDEQAGFASICRGVVGMFRNPTAHDPRILREVSDEELLELLMIASMIHRRLDSATVRP